MPFLIMSRTTGELFVKKELSRQSSWQVNNATSPLSLNKTFSAKYTQYISSKAYKKLYTASLWTYKPGMQSLAQ